jgi:hypothetical protein
MRGQCVLCGRPFGRAVHPPSAKTLPRQWNRCRYALRYISARANGRAISRDCCRVQATAQRPLVVDGELVVPSADGRSDFEKVRRRNLIQRPRMFQQAAAASPACCTSQTAPVGHRSSDRRPLTMRLLATTILSAIPDRKRDVEMPGDPDDDDRRIHIYSAAHSQGGASAAHTREKRACRVTRGRQGMPSSH